MRCLWHSKAARVATATAMTGHGHAEIGVVRWTRNEHVPCATGIALPDDAGGYILKYLGYESEAFEQIEQAQQNAPTFAQMVLRQMLSLIQIDPQQAYFDTVKELQRS